MPKENFDPNLFNLQGNFLNKPIKPVPVNLIKSIASLSVYSQNGVQWGEEAEVESNPNPLASGLLEPKATLLHLKDSVRQEGVQEGNIAQKTILLLKKERVPPHNGHPRLNEYDVEELSRYVESLDGTTGGLALAWKESNDIFVLCHDDFFILFTWTDFATRRTWKIVGVHLDTNYAKWVKQFCKILSLKEVTYHYFWVIGDFNTISAPHEKDGGRMKSASSWL
ncbi:hypothetical protein PIB30_066548 [Stylosanthes scabra]|uniref:Uncharacterized protein n=1 Tax=Stylosanthes scabra TaxID=79078 RepID=A0ABU6VKN2_9FABA|nr:hypothetical protein [Stylosanthes scabra]